MDGAEQTECNQNVQLSSTSVTDSFSQYGSLEFTCLSCSQSLKRLRLLLIFQFCLFSTDLPVGAACSDGKIQLMQNCLLDVVCMRFLFIL